MGNTAKAKRRIADGIRVNSYQVMCEAVERGVEYGYRRAHKHTDRPDEDMITSCIFEAVMSDVCDVFAFEPIE